MGLYRVDLDGSPYNPITYKQIKSVTGCSAPNAKQALAICQKLKFEEKKPEISYDLERNSYGKLLIDNPIMMDNAGKTCQFEKITVSSKTVTCSRKFPIWNFTNQLEREASQFSDNITIFKLNPGRVLVRIFVKVNL